MFFLKRLYVQFNHHIQNNLWYIIINEGTCAFEPCIYFRKEHQWCSHEVNTRMITVQYKAPQILKCCRFRLPTQKFKTSIHSSLYPSQMRVHYWYGPATAFFFIDKVTSVTEDSLQYLRKPVLNASTTWVSRSTHIFCQ
jgi:hypothetical protein